MSGQIYQLTFDGAPPEDWGAEDLDALHEFMDGRVQFDTPEQRPPRRQGTNGQGTNGQDRGRLSAKSSAAERWSR